jgi:hypothetical protein
MLDFPNSRLAIKELANEMVKHLKRNICDTKTPRAWTGQNFDLLEEFFGGLGVDCQFTSSGNGREFLWDFIGYIKHCGVLITAESEHDTRPEAIAADFDRLLYGISPLKLMICRIDKRFNTDELALEEAGRICRGREVDLKSSCMHYASGEIFIIYCVRWADKHGRNQDLAYTLQVEGEPNYAHVGSDQQFRSVTN